MLYCLPVDTSRRVTKNPVGHGKFGFPGKSQTYSGRAWSRSCRREQRVRANVSIDASLAAGTSPSGRGRHSEPSWMCYAPVADGKHCLKSTLAAPAQSTSVFWNSSAPVFFLSLWRARLAECNGAGGVGWRCWSTPFVSCCRSSSPRPIIRMLPGSSSRHGYHRAAPPAARANLSTEAITCQRGLSRCPRRACDPAPPPHSLGAISSRRRSHQEASSATPLVRRGRTPMVRYEKAHRSCPLRATCLALRSSAFDECRYT